MFDVVLTRQAEVDLLEIWNYIAENDSFADADHVIDKIEEAVLSLQRFPAKGHVVRELERICVYDYLEIHFKPYRIVYSMGPDTVYVYAIVDGRRDLERVLQDRIIRRR